MSSPEQPAITINIGEQRFEATPHNTALFRFAGKLSMYNHVFICTNQEDGMGTYVFNQNPTYDTFEEYMTANGYPLHDNLQGVADCDKEAFEKMINLYVAQIPDTVPENWG